METNLQKQEEQIKSVNQKSDEEKLREIIKKYSHQTKIYNEPRNFWWESAAYERYNR